MSILRRRFKKWTHWLWDKILHHVFLSVMVFISFACVAISTMVYWAEDGVVGSNIDGYWDAIWWGIVTLLTVGYGDRYPVTPEGRMFALMLMFCGVTAVGILTARISSFFLARELNDRRGVVDPTLIHDHLVICGWKQNMEEFLLQVLEANPEMEAANIVLVNNAPTEYLETIHADPLLAEIKVVKGDFFQKPILERAVPHRASKILILADSTPSVDGKPFTAIEADARTIMCAMTLKEMAKSVTVVAEIIDQDMDQYLRLANVNEIVYSRLYSRMLMAKSAQGTGIPNIIHQLLDPEGFHFLTTLEIPKSFVGKTYGEYVKFMRDENPRFAPLGILENSGNTHSVKNQALKKAQRTPNIEQLVANLQSVKNLKFNHPNFSPPPDYEICEGSLAIIIENRGEKENYSVNAA
ncbi:MAG: ion channel [Bdellovibrionales bacterium]